jgi:hypothetical protein
MTRGKPDGMLSEQKEMTCAQSLENYSASPRLLPR